MMDIFHFCSHPQYTALSYTWGDASLEEEVTLNGQSVRIQSNLAAALRQLKKMDTRGYIWADAICINQNDPAEKSTVVLHMDKIFSAAEEVFAWLGVSEVDCTDPAQSSDRLWGHLMEIVRAFQSPSRYSFLKGGRGESRWRAGTNSVIPGRPLLGAFWAREQTQQPLRRPGCYAVPYSPQTICDV